MALKILCRTIITCIVITILPYSITAQIKFQEVKLAEAEKVFIKEKSPYIIYFSADWCPSCKMMEETTFKDAKLADRINNNYLAYKVDVDKSYNKDWMKTYAVYSLPTTLFYHPDGKLIKRLELPITVSNFLKLTANLVTEAVMANTSIKKNIQPTKNLLLPSEYNAPKISTSSKPNLKKNLLFQQSKKIIGFLNLENPIQNGAQYIVKIGTYQNVRTVERLVQFIQNRLDYPVKVLMEEETNPSFTVYLGEFKTQKAAFAANQSLEAIQRKGVVRKF